MNTDLPKLAVIKVELRFDTEGTLKDCLPLAHKILVERFGLHAREYGLLSYETDPDDQDARVLTFLIGV